MTKTLERFDTPNQLPKQAQVVIIGGGIVGVSAALTLAERNISVVLIEKGHVAGEQSSRNLGWIRKTSRHHDDVPLALAADRLWASMSERLGRDVGYRQAGIMFLAQNDEQMAAHEHWLASVQGLNLDSRLLSPKRLTRWCRAAEASGAVGSLRHRMAAPNLRSPPAPWRKRRCEKGL